MLWADADADDVARASAYLVAQGVSAEFIQIPDGEFDGLPRPKHLPRATYGRLLMHKLLPDDFDRVLYVDGDTLVDIDIVPLIDTPLNGAIVGAVLDIGRVLVGRRGEAQDRLELGSDGDYFNAGVLLIDWREWCEGDVGQNCLQGLLADPLRFTQKDQCALNFVCRGRWTHLPLKWNYQPACVVHDDRENVLFHFLGSRKPWATDHVRHPSRFVKRYAALYNASPWADQFNTPQLPYLAKDIARIAKRIVTPRYWKNIGRYKELADRYEASCRGQSA